MSLCPLPRPTASDALMYAVGMNVVNGMESSHLAFYGLLGGSAAASAAALGGVMRHLRSAAWEFVAFQTVVKFHARSGRAIFQFSPMTEQLAVLNCNPSRHARATSEKHNFVM